MSLHGVGEPVRRSAPFAGQIALITGAGSPTGIGFATAVELGSLGAIIVIASTTNRIEERVGELAELGIEARGCTGDLTNSAAVAAMVATFGRIDICVNNAGMIAVGGTMADAPLESIADDQWNDSINRNLTTCFNVTRAVLPKMRAAGYGRIVNVASTSGPVQAFAGDAAYHAAKAGIIGLTRAAALEVASNGVTVNAVAPGWITTSSQTIHEGVAGSATPMRRSGTPVEIAAAIRFLAEPSASYITGQLLVIDGGNSLPEDRTWQP